MTTSLQFHTPASGDWLVITDGDTQIYSGHGHGDEMWAVLDYLNIEQDYIEYPDEEYEGKF